MDPVIPTDVDPEAVLGFSSLVMIPFVAGVVQVFVRSGLPIRHTSLLALVVGVGLGVAVSASTDGILIVGLVRGAAVGMSAFGVWVQFSRKVDTNGD